MPYVTVFEVTDKPFQWWFAASGLAIVAFGVVMFLATRKHAASRFRRAFFLLFFASGLSWSVGAFTSTYPEYRQCLAAYRSGHCSLVEGEVEHFQPAPYDNRQDECFTVQGVQFRYAGNEIQPGFSQTASHGGPIREGLPVRVAYYRGRILRLEVRADRLASAAERAAYSTAARERSEEAEENDPINDRGELAIGFGGVIFGLFLTADWRHFIRYWLRRPPPYSRNVERGFQTLFALGFCASVYLLVHKVLSKQRSPLDYLQAALIGLVMAGVLLCMDRVYQWQWKRQDERAAGQPDRAGNR
jgi:hypothetical protein